MKSPALAARHVVLTVEGAAGQAPVRLLDRISVDLWSGELVGLIGPNGAGKTTLLRVLGGHLRPTAGDLWLRGRPLHAYAARDRARLVGQVPQAAEIMIDFTCLEVALMGRHPHLRRLQPESPQDRALARAALAEVEMAALEDRRVSTLSAGERQRLLFARVRCQGTELLLCDEPTANLDLRHRALVFNILRRFVAGGGTVLAAVHDLDLAARFCDRLLLLGAGRVVVEGRPRSVLTPEHLRTIFSVEAAVHPDPVTGSPRVTVLGPT